MSIQHSAPSVNGGAKPTDPPAPCPHCLDVRIWWPSADGTVAPVCAWCDDPDTSDPDDVDTVLEPTRLDPDPESAPAAGT